MGNERVMTDHEHEWGIDYFNQMVRCFANGCTYPPLAMDDKVAEAKLNEHAKLRLGLEHIKRWASSYNVHVNPQIILDAVVRMCADALVDTQEIEEEDLR